MKNLEIKKSKNLGINFILLIVFAIHLFAILMVYLDSDFFYLKYPLFSLLDSYFATALIINPIIISSVVKKVIEIEEKNNMWDLQLSLGLKIPTILVNKFKNLSFKFFILQIVEWIIIITLSYQNNDFIINSEITKRIIIYFLSELFINLSMISIFIIIEMRSKKVYFSLFFSIIGAMSGIICMFTSNLLSQINPFALFSTLLNINYIKNGSGFIQMPYNINYFTILISFIYLSISVIYLIKNKKYILNKGI